MDVIHFPEDVRPSRWSHPVLALGNFDGVHRGHRKILERVQRVATERGATSVVMTFDPHPPRVVRPDKAPALLMTKEQKLEAIAGAGVSGAAIVRFTPELSRWDPETFVRTVLVDWLHVAEVWVGANFLFGHDRAGNFSLLRTLGSRYGFKAEKIDPVRYKDFVVSSTRIRRLVARDGWTRQARSWATSTSSTARSSWAISAAGPSAFRRQTCAPPTSCCRRTASMRRRPGLGRSSIRR
jgi:riboflavin kinase/FMN adenylyltransferase